MERNSLYESGLLRGEFLPEVVAYYFKQWDNYSMPFHAHNQVEIMYVIEGHCNVETEGASLQLKKGDFIILDAEVPHRLLVEKGSPCRMLNIEFRFHERKGVFPSIKNIAEEDPAFARFLKMNSPYLLLKDANEVYPILKSLVLEMDERGKENLLMVHLLLSQLFIRMARLAVETIANEPEHQANMYVKQALMYLHENYDCDIQMKDIAADVNLHPGYLHRIFKKHTGLTVMEYLTSVRMEKAKMLLSETDIPLIEISDYIGINSRQYFSSLFKKHTHQTPVEYRKTAMHKKEFASWEKV
ncbi:AraC family transcriptional regulator [Neobacillus cucumis]|uniref:AraC family transcriptional regulator n=1 Tax=Neobacillus cucumis TaxID=1740721 RepID=A0A2N5HVQ3_9BACI|nr:AraC family transcriptional regulator [Neobacillus cucumis]PLS09592.1 AraC family transcriptional regulator [Neobacillus cucumis]